MTKPIRNRNKSGLRLPSRVAQSISEDYLDALDEENALNPEALTVDKLRKKDIEIMNRIGEGAGGPVLKCLHKPTGHLMVKKIVPEDLNPEIQKKIMKEVNALKNCNSPYIVTYYGAYTENEDIMLYTEYCECGSLEAIGRRLSHRGKRTNEGILGRIAKSVTKAMAYLHKKQIIHRNIRPSNILVNNSGQIKLCDVSIRDQPKSWCIKFLPKATLYAAVRIAKLTVSLNPSWVMVTAYVQMYGHWELLFLKSH